MVMKKYMIVILNKKWFLFFLKIYNQLIINLNNKIINSTFLLKIPCKKNFIDKILSDAILINYLESEFSDTSCDTINEIRKLNNIILFT